MKRLSRREQCQHLNNTPIPALPISKDFAPPQLQRSIDDYLRTVPEAVIGVLTADEFQTARGALVTRFREPDRTLAEAFSRRWTAIEEETYDWARRAKLADALEAVTLEQVQALAGTGRHMQAFADTQHFHSNVFAGACKHLQALASICMHLQAFVGTRMHLQALAGSCRHLQALAGMGTSRHSQALAGIRRHSQACAATRRNWQARAGTRRNPLAFAGALTHS